MQFLLLICLLGTHDIINATFSGNVVQTVYRSEYVNASGALFVFLFNDFGRVDFSKSAYVALDRNASLNYTLRFKLYPGHYTISAYDIEKDKTLLDDMNYPAHTTQYFEQNNGGKISVYFIVINNLTLFLRRKFLI